MSGGSGGCAGCWGHLRCIRETRAECPGGRPDFRWMAGCPVVVGSSVEAGRVDLQGSDVRGQGRMSGAWELLLTPSIGSLHPWTRGLVRLHVHLRDGPLGT